MSDDQLVFINAQGDDGPTVAKALLDAADDPAEVRTGTGGFFVSKSLAEKAGVLEKTAVDADDRTEGEQGFTTSTETGPSPEGKGTGNLLENGEAVAQGDPAATEAQNDGGKPADEKANELREADAERQEQAEKEQAKQAEQDEKVAEKNAAEAEKKAKAEAPKGQKSTATRAGKD